MDFQTLNEDGPNPQGTGLGLGICRKILKKMGGTVKVKSKKGQGTTFKIYLTSLCRQFKEESENQHTLDDCSSSSVSFKSHDKEIKKNIEKVSKPQLNNIAENELDNGSDSSELHASIVTVLQKPE